MKYIAILLSLLSLILVSGCANGAGKQIAKGAIRGAGHGTVEQYGQSEIGKGAAHGALSSTYQVRDQNQAAKKRAKSEADEAVNQ
jgi:hypothetical protein